MKLSRSFARFVIGVFALGIAAIAIAHSSVDRGRNDSKLLDALLEIEAAHPALCASSLDADAIRERIAVIAEAARKYLEAQATSVESGTDVNLAQARAESAVIALNGIVFGHEALRSSPDLHDPCNLLVSGVLERSQGYCLGLAAVYLTVAERIGLPIHAVGTPSHVFLRYDDGSTRINIETMSGGASVADEEYIDRQRIAPESIRKGVFLRRLSTERFLAQVCNNLGVIYSERKDPVRAAAEYEKALALDPRLPAAWYNLGKDAMTQNRPKEAVRAFTKTIALHPNDTWALNNRGIAFSRLDKRAKARADFEAALRIDPGFEQARAGLASLAVP